MERRPFEAALDGDQTLFAERLRDGRVALGTRLSGPGGEVKAGELHLLPPSAALALAAWLAPLVEREWLPTVRDRLADQLATADDLYGGETGRVERLAERLVAELPPRLLARALILLANSIGPDARVRMVEALNTTDDVSEEALLRRRLLEEGDAFAYVVAAAALFDALDER